MRSTLSWMKVEKSNRNFSRLAMFLICSMVLFSSCTYDHVQPDVCFESEVLPVFVTYCSTSGCHNPTDRQNGYDLTNYNGIMQGVRPKNILGSSVVSAMSGLSEERMPPSAYPQPSGAQIATIKSWVKSGATNTTNCSGFTCDTAAVVTYSGDIQPMLVTYCIGCHGGGNPSGGINLTDFVTVKQTAQVGRLGGSISGNPTYITMPPNSSLLPSCYVTKIEKWVTNGAPNN